MCGIAAIISNKRVNKRMVESMLDAIVHRGPDDWGIKSLEKGKVMLGHRRLSIIDLSILGHQPMEYMKGRYSITYNGEIYNYIELRQELHEKGYEFKTSTDTEVIMAAYDAWGTDCLNKFNGMWALVIYDSLEQKIIVSRDRFGVKPLYYWISSHGFVAFASEIKEFFRLPGWSGHIEPQKTYEYLMYGITDNSNETMFAGVYQLRGGEFAKFSIHEQFNDKYIHRWYGFERDKFSGSFLEAAEIFKELFYDSVRIRLRSDVAIGSCLSGGLDSSSIVCVINELLKERREKIEQVTISAGAENKSYDEMKYVQMVIDERPEIQSVKVYPEINMLFDSLPKLLYHQDEPFRTTSIYASWRVFETAAQSGMKVMIDGQGADETLAGYDGFYSVRFASLIKQFKILQLAKEIKASKDLRNIHYLTWMKSLLKMILGVNETIYGGAFKLNKRTYWLNSKQLGISNYGYEGLRFSSSVWEEQIKELFTSTLPQLLHYEDRNTMAFSIEGRLPFLDYRLVEFILSLPEEYCISDGITKRVLRKSMINVLPDGIRTRMSKLGFVTPEEVWLKSNPEPFKEKVRNAIEYSNGIITPYANKHVDDIAEGRIPWDFSVWRIICFGEWMKNMA